MIPILRQTGRLDGTRKRRIEWRRLTRDIGKQKKTETKFDHIRVITAEQTAVVSEEW